jgi:hypothetical protein
MCIVLTIALLGCGSRVVGSTQDVETSADETSGTDSRATTTSRESESESDAESDTENESDAEAEAETGADTDSSGVDGECHPIETERVNHAAFYGAGCMAPHESTMLTTQDEVDAHTSSFCDECWWDDDCNKAPKLKKDTAILYTYAATPMGPAHLEITSVEECGESIVVKGFATMGCQLAYDRAWDSVAVPVLDKPIVVEVENPFPEECEPAKCPDGVQECLPERRSRDCPRGMACITGCCAFPS